LRDMRGAYFFFGFTTSVKLTMWFSKVALIGRFLFFGVMMSGSVVWPMP
jgi:hypothetical protein